MKKAQPAQKVHAAHATHARHGHDAHAPKSSAPQPQDTEQPSAVDAVQPVAGTYSQDDLAQLLYMIEEEKLAGDVYEALYAQTGVGAFDQIAASEDRHFDILLEQAQNLGVAVDGILALPEGQYSSPELQTLYDGLMLAASISVSAALEVGVAIETTDIADLQAASTGLDGTALGDVYANLLVGSVQHLNAFENLLT